jgi:hypothetical protein
MDVGGSSDPYLVLKHGPGLATTIVDKKRYYIMGRSGEYFVDIVYSLRKETLNPEFYCAYEFQVCGVHLFEGM